MRWQAKIKHTLTNFFPAAHHSVYGFAITGMESCLKYCISITAFVGSKSGFR